MPEFKLTSQNCSKYFGHLEDHQYRHFNTSLNTYIYSKNHFIHEMNTRNMLPYEIAEREAEKWDREHSNKGYKEISPKSMNIIRSLRQTADKNGNLKLGSRAIKALREIGAIKPISDHMPKEYIPDGGIKSE